MLGIKVFSLIAGAVLASALPAVSTRSSNSTNSSLPIVDLQYSLHQATINETGSYYNFSNIRYAAPPTGKLRFAAPIVPQTINRTVNDGQQGSICAAADPYWELLAEYYLEGANTTELDYIEEELDAAESALTISGLSAPDPRTSEDCLFLDVITPKSIFNEKCEDKAGAPVLVWIYGGGYVNGDKTSSGNPATLISRSQNGGEGVVYVAMNYRVGLFGWLSGPTFKKSGGVANAGLHDQRLALEWVQKYIHLFGGDPKRVTVIGESAGAGSIMHQITAYGSRDAAPFSKAILQSPGWSPVAGDAQQEATFQSVLSQAQTLIGSNITSVSALKNVSFPTLARLNRVVVARSSPYGTFTFGPVVDGTFVPKLPGVLLLEGKFDHKLSIMVGHNSDEGIVFTNPLLATEAELSANIREVLPTISNSSLFYIQNTLYPPIYNGSYSYTSITERVALLTAELSFTCNTRYLDLAFNKLTHAYYFAVPPGLHGEDISYTFFNGDTTTSDDGLSVNATVAETLQTYITNFALSKDGNPNGRGVPYFPKYGRNSTVVVLGDEGLGSLQVDTTANPRCGYWQKATYA